jgi:Leucine-rich repeat (LRR) protein
LPIFPEAILTLTRLKSLSLRNCGLTHIPEALKQLPNLEHLHLQENPNLVYDAKDWTHLKSLTV